MMKINKPYKKGDRQDSSEGWVVKHQYPNRAQRRANQKRKEQLITEQAHLIKSRYERRLEQAKRKKIREVREQKKQLRSGDR